MASQEKRNNDLEKTFFNIRAINTKNDINVLENTKKEFRRFRNSVKYSLEGLANAYKSERSLIVHLVWSIIVFTCAFLFRISSNELVLSICLMGGVLAIELINTAIESVVDLVTLDVHPLAKRAKDIASAASFMFSICTIIGECIIFFPYIFKFFGWI